MDWCIRITWTLIVGMSLSVSLRAHGANIASDNAADAAYNSGWVSGANGGSGFAAWSLLPVGTPPQFSYIIAHPPATAPRHRQVASIPRANPGASPMPSPTGAPPRAS